MSCWKNPTSGRQSIVVRDDENTPTKFVAEAGEVVFVPDTFDFAVPMLAGAWVKTSAPEPQEFVVEEPKPLKKR